MLPLPARLQRLTAQVAKLFASKVACNSWTRWRSMESTEKSTRLPTVHFAWFKMFPGTGVPEFVEHHATVTEWRLDGSNSVWTQPIVKKDHRNTFAGQVVSPGNEHARTSWSDMLRFVSHQWCVSIKWYQKEILQPHRTVTPQKVWHPSIKFNHVSRFIHVHSHHLRRVCECSSHASQTKTWRRGCRPKHQLQSLWDFAGAQECNSTRYCAIIPSESFETAPGQTGWWQGHVSEASTSLRNPGKPNNQRPISHVLTPP